MKSRIFLLSIFLFLLTLIRCGCPEPGIFYFSWNGMDISNTRYQSYQDGSWKPWPTDDTVFYGTTFGLNVKILTQVMAKSEYKIDFSNSANAFSKCEPDVYKPKIQVKGFKIFTLNDFDEKHHTGSDISEYFFSENHSEDFYLLFLNEDSPDAYKELEWLRLSHVPTSGSVHKFRLELFLENGTKLSGETKEVSLLPGK
jgi:hypothetical protein